jgi:hypothetical protein
VDLTGGNNLHRNITFRDNATKASLVEPDTTQKPLAATTHVTFGSGWLATSKRPVARCSPSRTTAISAADAGFQLSSRSREKPIDHEYAETRAQRGRIYEVTQIKGDGETLPAWSWRIPPYAIGSVALTGSSQVSPHFKVRCG